MSKVSSGETKNTLYCSFCGKSQHEVRKLIAGPTVFICDECVELCMDIIGEENKSSLTKSRDGIPTPKEIRKVLDDYVIGQDPPFPSRTTTSKTGEACSPVRRTWIMSISVHAPIGPITGKGASRSLFCLHRLREGTSNRANGPRQPVCPSRR
jgi:hypothetical protein